MIQPLFLIRHAPVTIDLTVPSEQWQLSAEGRALAERIAALPILRDLRTVWSSPEPKAQATARPLAARHAAALVIQPDLAELRRGPANLPDRAAYDAAVRAAFARPDRSISGWEPARDARRRIVGCVRAVAAQASGPIAVVSHGLVLSLLLAHLRGQDRVDVAEWRSIPLPALAIVDSLTWKIIAPFHPVTAWEQDESPLLGAKPSA
ncbi:MAG TPA: histidine phosphatase family protein [Herpetosiphonaceae bacterium]